MSDKSGNYRKIARSISCALMLFVLLIVSIAAFFGAKAWFASNKEANAGGMSLSVKTDFMKFADTFTAKAVMGNVTIREGTFKRDDDLNYYLYDEKSGQFVTENGKKTSLSYDSLYPGEYIEFEMKVTCSEQRKGEKFSLYFEGLEGSDKFSVNGVDYSILGVYKIVSETYPDGEYMAKYDENGSEFPNRRHILDKEFVPEEDGYMSVSFRLYIDIGQYRELKGAATNLLSEKKIKISGVVLEPEESV